MKAKILEALKTKYSSFGLSAKAFDGVAEMISKTITEESQIDAAIDSVEPFVKAYQSDVDKERSASAKLKKELEGAKAQPEPKKETQAVEEPEIPAYMAKLLERLDNQDRLLQQMAGEKVHASKLEQINSALKEKGVPQTFSSVALLGRTFGEDANVEELVSSIEAGYNAHRDAMANESFAGGKAPEKGSGGNESPLDSIVDTINKGTEELLKESKQ